MNVELIIFFLLNFSIHCLKEDETYQKFEEFIQKESKSYKTLEEYNKRYQIFKRNLAEIETYSKKVSHKMGLTSFSDISNEELKDLNCDIDPATGKITDAKINGLDPKTIQKSPSEPSELDYRKLGYVSPVENQGNCKCAWAFSTIGNIEGQYFKKYGKIMSLSAQYLVDCTGMGCGGGKAENAYQYIIRHGGSLPLQESYPYKGKAQDCKTGTKLVEDLVVKKFVRLGTCTSRLCEVDEEYIKSYLYLNGPLYTAMNPAPLSSYTGGIIDLDENQCPHVPTKCILLIGYGHDNKTGLDYWIVKNTFGESWGENGYFRIRRGKGTCGLNQLVMSAEIE